MSKAPYKEFLGPDEIREGWKPRDLTLTDAQILNSLCGLCGNFGIINTLGKMFSPAGVHCGVRRYCICPNGRVMKRKVNAQRKKAGLAPSNVPPLMPGRP